MPIAEAVILILIAPAAALLTARTKTGYIGNNGDNGDNGEKKPKFGEFVKQEKLYIAVMSAVNIIVSVLLIISANTGKRLYPWSAAEFALLWDLFAGCAYIDLRVKKIPNDLLLYAFLVRTAGIAAELFLSERPADEIIFFSVIGGASGAIIILLCRFFSRGGVGMGDVKSYALAGYYFGFAGLINIMFYSLFSAAIVAIFILVTKRGKKGSTLAMGPFILLGITLYLTFSII